MENVIAERVKEVKLTKTQRKIADYFIRNPEWVGIHSSLEVAREIGVSDASITRFARAIGYTGFPDLKSDIYNNLAMRASNGFNTVSLAERFDISQKKYGHVFSRDEYIKNAVYTLERTFQQNDEAKLDSIVSMLRDADHRYIAGFRGCLGVAARFAFLLRMIVDHVVSVTEEGPGGISILQDIGPGDCLLLFSVSRFYKLDVDLLKIAKARGGRVCVITDSVLSPMAKDADILLLVETRSMSFFHSATALNMTAEYIVSRLSEEYSEEYRKKVVERDEITKELRL